MNPTTEKIKNWISASFQLITVALLTSILLFQIKQQKDLRDLNAKLDQLESRLSSDIKDAKSSLSSDIDNVKRSLGHEIDDVRRLVILFRD